MRLWDRVAAVLFPKQCPFCGKVIPPEARCCGSCMEQLPKMAASARWEGTAPLKGIFPAFVYRDGAARAIRGMKFHGRPAIARHLAPFLAEALPKELHFDAIVPIPMSRRNIRQRGYNQAALLAKFLSGEICVPVEEALVKIRRTRPQHTLNARERQSNLAGAYAPAREAELAGKVLLLCDDVTTTGVTLREAAGVLLAAGAREVYAVTAAAAVWEGDALPDRDI